MRIAPLALVLLAATACRRGALQDDGGGTGTIGFDGGHGGANGGDAAGGVTDGSGGSIDGPAPTADANCGMTGWVKSVLPAEILIVMDRSVSLAETDWNTFLSAVAAMIDRNASAVDWGLYTFPADGPACGIGTVSAAIDLPPTPDAATHVIVHAVTAGTGAGGSPIAAAIDVAAAYMRSRTTPNPKFLMLVTDGAPSCAGRADPLSADPIQAQTDAFAAISAAKTSGVPTFVVAPSAITNARDVDALNALAVAGGYPEPGGRFASEKAIATWFTAVSTASTCAFALATRPPVPDVVTVTLNGAPVPRDRSHAFGWDYTDATSTTLSLYGLWCDMAMTERMVTVNVYFGCPNP